MSSKRSSRNSRRMTYGRLEPRMMLSADLDVARSLIVGGDFETTGPTEFVAFADGDQSNQQAIDFRTVQTDFGRIVQLDSIAGQLDSLAQNVITEVDTEYIIAFDLRGRPINSGDAADTNDVEVLFGGESLGVFTGIDRWQTISVSVTADAELTQLEFREVSESSDGRGILLDHISVAEVEQIAVTNGSLENVDGDVTTGVVTSENLPGFFAIGETGDEGIGVSQVADATDGNNVFNLNTSNDRADRVFQNIRTEAGGRYFVSFDLRNGDSTDSDPVDLRVRWNGEFAGSFSGTADWQRFGFVANADDGFSTLVFREPGNATGDGVDAQIDNIQVYRIGSIVSDFSIDLNGAAAGTDFGSDFVENGSTQVTADDLTLQFDNGNFLRSATVRVLGFTGTETLTANTTGTNIETQFNSETGILRLVGRDQVSDYQDVLRSLQFSDSNDNPTAGERRLLISVTDGTEISERPEVVLNVIPVNDAPVVTALGDIPLAQNTPLTLSVDAVDPDNEQLAFAITVTGDTEIFGDSLPTINDQGQIQLETVRDGTALITVDVRDADGLGEQFSFNVTTSFELPTAEIPDDFQQFSGNRQLSNTDPALRNNIYDAAPAFNIDTSLNYQAVIETADGEIRFDLFENESPITVNNFVNLAEDGFFDGLTFHRVIEGFVAQGGDPTGAGAGGPGYQFADELDNGLEFNGFGQLAKANSGPDTNGSQFFFTLNDSPAFAGEHTIFGQVIEGEQVLRDVNLTTPGGEPEVIRRVRIEIV